MIPRGGKKDNREQLFMLIYIDNHIEKETKQKQKTKLTKWH